MKKIIENIKSNYKYFLGVLVIGILVGILISTSTHQNINTPKSQAVGTSEHDHSHEKDKDQTWTCSMHPQIKQDEPGQCPICGMDLIPLSETGSGGESIDPDDIQMTEAAMKLADIQTTGVKRSTPLKTLYLQGKVDADERLKSRLTARFGGRIEKLYISFTGQQVNKGQKLATIYSPNLVTAQRELLEASRQSGKDSPLFRAAKSKLKLWDLSDDQIDRILKQDEPIVYFDVRSPIAGTVMHRNVSVGDYVKEGQRLFQVTDLSKVWVMFDAYESDLPWISRGDKVKFEIRALPGRDFEGEVNYIDPFITEQSRVVKVRVEVNNEKRQIKPGMFAQGKLYSTAGNENEQLLIPKTAVLWTGKRAVVYVKDPNADRPVFEHRQIELGPETSNAYVVLEGLSEGEEVVTNGVFKIDAAAQLAGKPSMMNAEGGKPATGHNHGGQNTGGEESHEEHQANVKKSDIDPQFKKQLTEVYKAYLPMKDALVASDATEAKNTASETLNRLKEVDMKLLEGDAHMLWMDLGESLKKDLKAIAGSEDLGKQRKAFVTFNNSFYKAVNSFGLDGVKTYYQYCPMANNDQGAYWFSDEEAIRNPYYGEMMLKCGEVREKIE